MTLKEMFMRYVAPILVFPAMIFAVWGTDRFLVWNGIRHAKALCADPGPLIVHDRAAWEAYSSALRARLTDDDDANWDMREQLRKEMGIRESSKRIVPKNPLFITAKYAQDQLWNERRLIATLNGYGADDLSPIGKFFLFVGANSREYTCWEHSPDKYASKYLEF